MAILRQLKNKQYYQARIKKGPPFSEDLFCIKQNAIQSIQYRMNNFNFKFSEGYIRYGMPW